MKRILSVSYDFPLATTRQLILERHGFEVTTVGSQEEAVAACHDDSFDLLIVGHSIPSPDKSTLVQVFRDHSQSPVLSLSPNGFSNDVRTEYNASSSDPAELLYVVRSALRLRDELGSLLNDAIAHTQADFGTLQLLNRSGRALQIAVQRGFGQEFLGFFRLVPPTGTACGEAMKQGTRVVVEDVASSAVYDEDSRRTMLRADAAACHSTPLIDETGRLVGMVSSHYQSPQRPSGTAFDTLDAAVIRTMKRARQDLDVATAGGRRIR